MNLKTKCPLCGTDFDVDIKYGFEYHICPKCGSDLEITSVYDDNGKSLSISAKTVAKKKKDMNLNAITADGVREIAEMQRYIDDLENFLYRMAQCIEGRDHCPHIIKFTESGTITEYSANKIYDFIILNTASKEGLQ